MSAPRISMAGQLAFVLGIALLVAQAFNLLMLTESRARLRDSQDELALTRFVGQLESAPALSRRMAAPGPNGRRLRRVLSFSEQPKAFGNDVDERRTALLKRVLAEANRSVEGAAVAQQADRQTEGRGRTILIVSAATNDNRYLNAVIPSRPEPRLPLGGLLVQTIVLYTVLLAASLLVTTRLSRPLRRLTAAADAFRSNPQGQPPALAPEGPDDVRLLMTAFGAMRDRIAQLFLEKDVMLGALGHDLRTPLTALRIRVESVTDQQLRDSMITSIETLTVLIDDILDLARTGGEGHEREILNLPTLIGDVQNDYADNGARMTFIIGPDALPAVTGYPRLVRRALGNLIDNGLKFGQSVTIDATVTPDHVGLRVMDDGPGVSDAALNEIRTAFVRGESSRNRETGGTGLGLAIVEGIATAHGGSLDLENRAEGGFVATLWLPLDVQTTL